MKSTLFATAAMSALAFTAPAHAAIVTYIGSDNAVSSLAQMTNSVAASNAFNAAVSGATLINFETALPSGVAITGGTTTNSSCGSVCGFNTTPGGSNFRYTSSGGTVTFNFATAISAFGFFATGVQNDIVTGQTVTFSDGTSQSIAFPSSTNGGGLFIGFTDFGKSITSVSINGGGDIIAIDDVRFASTAAAGAVPEPATWAMMIGGFGAIGGAMRYRRRKASVSFA